jgi:DNA-directed RNA polymerase beta subunit
LQYYCERPLVTCFGDSLTYPNGHNCIIALALYTGQNQEDSIILNRSSVDCGMFNASCFNNEKAKLEKNEQFGNPDLEHTKGIKKGTTYEFTDEKGFIREGTIAKKGHILIVKCAKIPKPKDQYLYEDRSIEYKYDEPVYIEKVITPRNDEDALIAKVKTRAVRPIGIGDKLSSRTGNKGIIAKILDRVDMPYCENGLIPDAIVNSHSIPTRMAINQIIECVIAQLAVERGSLIDATTFRSIDLAGMLQELETYGIKYGGHQRMYNGMTGEWLDVAIFIGPTTYQRLQKFVIDEHYSVRRGPTTQLTRQPLDGTAKNGGLRIGEMEKDVLASHGVGRLLHEKFYKNSDGANIYVCRICQNRAIVNEREGIYKCKYCEDAADIAEISSSWVANLFFSEAAAMGIHMGLDLQPYEYLKEMEK